MYVGFDFNKVDHAGSPFLMVCKDCPSCGRSYAGYRTAKYCWPCSCARPVVDTQKHRASKLGLTEHFTAIEWILLCLKYDCKCLSCGEVTSLSPDHVIPLARGGKNTIDNIQPLCKRCNSVKKDRSIDYRI